MTIASLAALPGDDDHDAQLAKLGLTLEQLAEARGRAQHDVDECTDLDPPGSRGQVRHMRTVRYLREILIPHGWIPDDTGNVGAVVSPDGTVAIVVTSGDAGTGLLIHRPKTKYPKGEVTHRRVRQNIQLSLFEDLTEEPLDDDVDEPTRTTWVLLQHPAGDVVRAELSCPMGVDDAGRINEWSERIILPELPLDTHETWIADDDEGDDQVDVPVTPR